LADQQVALTYSRRVARASAAMAIKKAVEEFRISDPEKQKRLVAQRVTRA
jgi:hypothetical protein